MYISLCSCLGKIMEKIVVTQIDDHLRSKSPLHNAQYGFMANRSTLNNLLFTDAHIAQLTSKQHCFDIISFDFAKAFDKAPHDAVVKAASLHGISGMALKWIKSFLTERTQQVRVGSSYSSPTDVISGVVQGSVCGPRLYTIFIDSLIRKIRLPLAGFADDIKFLADVAIHSAEEVQTEINVVVDWSKENHTPLSAPKCGVLHCGVQPSPHKYVIEGTAMPSIDTFTDLGVRRTGAVMHSDHYREHYEHVVSAAAKKIGFLRQAFRSRARELMWPAFMTYVLPSLMYCSPAWNPSLQRDIQAIENVQRRYTKHIRGLENLSYKERLQELGALSLANRRSLADMATTFKYLHGIVDCPASDVGLAHTESNTVPGLEVFTSSSTESPQRDVLCTIIIVCNLSGTNCHCLSHKPSRINRLKKSCVRDCF